MMKTFFVMLFVESTSVRDA